MERRRLRHRLVMVSLACLLGGATTACRYVAGFAASDAATDDASTDHTTPPRDGADMDSPEARPDAPADARPDAPTPDAPPPDAPTPDATPPDAPTPDATPPDVIGPSEAILDSVVPLPPTLNIRSIGRSAATSSTATVTNGVRAAIFTALPNVGDQVVFSNADVRYVVAVAGSTVTFDQPYFGSSGNELTTIAPAYSSLASWAADRAGASLDLRQLNRRELALIYDIAAATATALIAAATSATHDIEVRTAPSFSHGAKGGSLATLRAASGNITLLRVASAFTRLFGLEMKSWCTASDVTGTPALQVEAATVRAERLMLHEDGRTSSSPAGCGAIVVTSGARLTLVNSIVHTISGDGVHAASGSQLNIYASTLFGCNLASDLACVRASGNVEARNVVAIAGSAAAFSGIFGGLTSHNAADDASAPGTFPQKNVNPALNFVNTSTDPYDLHLRAGAPLIGQGTPLSVVSDDIDGDPRLGAWDIGADER